MEERTTGLILRTRPLTETSLIVHWLTQDFGRLSTVAKGARRPKSPFTGKLDLLYLAEFTFRRSRRSDLHTLQEVAVRDFHSKLREELIRLERAAYFINLIEQTTEIDTPIPAIFDLLNSAVTVLSSMPSSPATVFMFEMKLLAELGLQPDLSNAKLSPGTKDKLGRFVEEPWDSLQSTTLTTSEEIEIRQYLHGFLIYEFGRLPATRTPALATVR